jgi:hypothetical protein
VELEAARAAEAESLRALHELLSAHGATLSSDPVAAEREASGAVEAACDRLQQAESAVAAMQPAEVVVSEVEHGVLTSCSGGTGYSSCYTVGDVALVRVV